MYGPEKNVQSIFPNNIHFPISASVAMAWNSSFLVLMASLYLMNLAIANNPCKTGVSVPGMALKGFVFKKFPVTAPHVMFLIPIFLNEVLVKTCHFLRASVLLLCY